MKTLNELKDSKELCSFELPKVSLVEFKVLLENAFDLSIPSSEIIIFRSEVPGRSPSDLLLDLKFIDFSEHKAYELLTRIYPVNSNILEDSPYLKAFQYIHRDAIKLEYSISRFTYKSLPMDLDSLVGCIYSARFVNEEGINALLQDKQSFIHLSPKDKERFLVSFTNITYRTLTLLSKN